MQMNTIKETACQLIGELPDDADWEKVLYTLQIRHDIEEGIADDDAGRVVTSDQLRRNLGLDQQ